MGMYKKKWGVIMAERNSLRERGCLFVISAPSGTGKTTLVEAVLARMAHQRLERVVTYTSRQPRIGEREGVDYYFITEELFSLYRDQGFFLEWSGSYGNLYGTPSSMVNKLLEGVSLLLIIDRAGARAICRILPEALLIWITPPSYEVLEQRLRVRGTDAEAVIQRRLSLAREELEAADRDNLYHHHLVNENFGVAAAELVSLLESYLK